MSDQTNNVNLETITSLAKRRGFVFQASEIYGGLSGFWDYGPYGVEMVNRIKKAWWDEFVRMQPNIYGVDGAIIQNSKLWQASGHVGGFNDPLVDCKNCKARHRADHLADTDSTDLEELNKLLDGRECPNCGKKDLTEARTYNMMMKTYVGPIEDEDSVSYLRPETAGSIFTNFDLVRETTRSKIPFGIAQIGKAFRNEISPRDFLFRVREFEQMEIEYFVESEDAEAQLEQWKEACWNFLKDKIGLDENKIEWHQHSEDERAHYAADSWDINYSYPFGSKELWGIANRTNYDLEAHFKKNNELYFDQANNKKFTPFVIEPSVGVSRLFLAALDSAYTEEEVDGDSRVVLKLHPSIAPVDFAILPLSKKPELQKLAKEIYANLVEQGYNVEYDETQSIGKRYRRQDEIGTPKCITVDFESLEGDSVTVRDRDTMQQTRVAIKEL